MDNVQVLENQILESMTGNLNGPYPINDLIEIDAETRSIIIPNTELIFGVKTDQDAERKYFRCPKIVGNNLDLSELSLRVHFENANQEKDKYMIDDVVVDGDYITFSWLLSKKVLKYIGSVNFAICAVRTDYETGELKVAWNTTLGVGTVLMGLEVEDLTEDEEMESRDVLQQLLDMMDSEANENVQDVKTEGDTQIANVKSEGAAQLASMKTEGASQVETIETTGQNVLASIPEDYTAMTEQVGWNSRYLAPTVEQVAEGEIICLTDSADMPLIGLNVYGKSEQASTTGAQLLQITRDNAYFQAGLTCTPSNNDVLVSGTHTSELIWFEFGKVVLEAEKTYTLSCTSGFAIHLWNLTDNVEYRTKKIDVDSITFTPTSNIECAVVLNDAVLNRTYSNTPIAAMLVEGESILPWEPYTGGKAAPNPDYPQEIVSVSNPTSYVYGKNLIQNMKGDHISGDEMVFTVLNDGGIKINGVSESERYYTFDEKNDIPVCDTELTAQLVGSNGRVTLTIGYFKADGSFVNSIAYSAGGEVTFKYPKEAVSTRTFMVVSKNEVCNDLVVYPLIKLAEASDEFEASKTKQDLTIPYTLHAVPVASDGNYTDDSGQQYICDEVDFERGVYIQRIGRYIVTGEESWYISNLQNFKDEGYYRYDVNTVGTTGALTTESLCTHFPYNGANFKGAWVLDQEEYLSLRLIAPYSSVEALKTFFTEQYTSDNPVTYYYVLWNPIETPLNAEELEAFKALRTNYPNSTITNDCGALQKVTYATDTKTYIDNKFAELAAKLV